jgi:pheromone shutdown protein TraB
MGTCFSSSIITHCWKLFQLQCCIVVKIQNMYITVFMSKIISLLFRRRVAQELGVPLGDEVGYAIRFEDRTSERTCIK